MLVLFRGINYLYPLKIRKLLSYENPWGVNLRVSLKNETRIHVVIKFIPSCSHLIN